MKPVAVSNTAAASAAYFMRALRWQREAEEVRKRAESFLRLGMYASAAALQTRADSLDARANRAFQHLEDEASGHVGL